MRPLFLLALLLCHAAGAQNNDRRSLTLRTTDVTIFLNGAQVFASGGLSLPAGTSELRIAGLPPRIDEKSIQVRGEGDFTLLSVTPRTDYLDTLRRVQRGDSLVAAGEVIRDRIVRDSTRLEVLAEKMQLLRANRNLTGQGAGTTVAQLRQALELYETQISAIKQEEITLRERLADDRAAYRRVRQQLATQTPEEAPAKVIDLKVEAARPTTARFTLSYLVEGAGWFPGYDVRVDAVGEPLQLLYKAQVYQNTGVDWEDVRLRFSNGEPRRSGTVPELETWRLDYARYTVRRRTTTPVTSVSGVIVDAAEGMPLPGVNVVVTGTSIGTSSNVDGRYRLQLPANAERLTFSYVGYQSQDRPISSERMNVGLYPDLEALDEIVVMGYSVEDALKGRVAGVEAEQMSAPPPAAVVPTTVIERTTTVEIEAETPYTVRSNGEPLTIDLRRQELPADYRHYAVPKLDPDAFLVARVADWRRFNLLSGEANLYFEDRYVGRSVLDADATDDTLLFSLGRDRGVAVEREKVDDFTRRRTLGTNVQESRGYRLTVRNDKTTPVSLTLFDQVPVAARNTIDVDVEALGGGELNERTGRVTWRVQLPPGERRTFELRWDVKYPKGERVILE
ncbi:MAG: mucoidy inhibitor MuiA family protein [Catalinimonas sp.]